MFFVVTKNCKVTFCLRKLTYNTFFFRLKPRVYGHSERDDANRYSAVICRCLRLIICIYVNFVTWKKVTSAIDLLLICIRKHD